MANKLKIDLIFFITLFALLFHIHSIGYAQERLLFTTVKGSADVNAGVAIIKEAYNRLGIDIMIELLPGKEALEASNSGKADGEVQRIDGISKTFTNLVQVPIPVNYLQGAAFSNKYNFPIKGWFSLEPYRIGIVRGILFAEQGTQGMDVKVAESYRELVVMLEKNEIDVAVMPRINGRVALKERNSKDIRELEGVLETLFLYHYLHKKNQQLVPRLKKVLKRMLLDGTTRQTRRRVYKQLLEGN